MQQTTRPVFGQEVPTTLPTEWSDAAIEQRLPTLVAAGDTGTLAQLVTHLRNGKASLAARMLIHFSDREKHLKDILATHYAGFSAIEVEARKDEVALALAELVAEIKGE